MSSTDSTSTEAAPVTVLAVGNPIMGDDGAGQELLTRLRRERPDPRVDYVDGGTDGLALVPVVAGSSRLLVLDAVADAGTPPGSVVRLDAGQLPKAGSSRLSPHELALSDVLAAVRLLGSEPDEVHVVGVVSASVELRVGLSPVVAEALPSAVAAAAAVLDGWLAGTPARGPLREVVQS